MLGTNPSIASPVTPGSLGHNDAASPDTPDWFVGNTPGSLGINDSADPTNGTRFRSRAASSADDSLLASAEPTFVALKTAPDTQPLDCIAQDKSGAIWHFWLYSEDVIVNPVPRYVILGSSRTSPQPGDSCLKSTKRFSIWDPRRVEEYVKWLNDQRSWELEQRKKQEEFDRFAKAAAIGLDLAGIFVPLLWGVSLEYELFSAGLAIEALNLCVKAETGGITDDDITEALQVILVDCGLFKIYAAVCPPRMRSILKRTDKGYEIYHFTGDLFAGAQAYAPLGSQRPTSVDGDLLRIHRFRYVMDADYANHYDNVQKIFQHWMGR